MKNDFVHLNFHSEYSLLESCCSLDKIKSECVARDYEALALTDTGNISGAIKFYKECTKIEDKEGKPLKPIKPILGTQMFLCEDIAIKEERDYSPIILLAKNNDGFKNIEILSHISHVDGFYYKPRIDYQLLEKHAKDVICISTDLNGSVQKLLRRNKIEEATVEAKKFKEMFGSDYYIEIQNNAQTDQELVNKNVLDISKKLGIDIVATNDVRYYKKDHYLAHLVLQASKDRKTVRSDKFTAIKTKERYFKSIDEMKLAFKDYPNDVLHNTVKIAEQCNVVFKFGGMRLPEINIPKDFNNEWEYLKFLSFNGLKERGLAGRQEYVDRLEDELFDVKMVNETKGYNFSRYFLIVWDYVNQARQNNVRLGVGRGCFTPECKVDCENGSKRISDIKKGDMVLSYDGKFHEVLNTLNYDVEEELIEIELEDGRKITCTHDHEIHVNRNGILVWVKASELTEEDEIFDIRK